MNRFLAALCWLTATVGGPAFADIRVKDSADLLAKLRVVEPGTVLRLEPGSYAGFTTKHKQFKFADRPVVITSDDPSKPATLLPFSLTNTEGLTFRDLHLQADGPPNGYAFRISSCKALRFERIVAHGSLDDDPSNDASALQIRGCDGVAVVDSTFRQLGRALAISTSRNIVASGNEVREIRSDGFNFAGVTNVRVSDNSFRDFFWAPPDHPDAIQFWTRGTTTPSTDVVVARNLIEKGAGRGMQGVFITDQSQGKLPYERITIEDNLVMGGAPNGIRVQFVKGLTLRRNEVVTRRGEPNGQILVIGAETLASDENRATSVSINGNNKTAGRTTAAVSDLGAAAKSAWLARVQSASPNARGGPKAR